jgi:hypothetical protein
MNGAELKLYKRNCKFLFSVWDGTIDASEILVKFVLKEQATYKYGKDDDENVNAEYHHINNLYEKYKARKSKQS